MTKTREENTLTVKCPECKHVSKHAIKLSTLKRCSAKRQYSGFGYVKEDPIIKKDKGVNLLEPTLQRRSAETQSALGLIRNIHIKKEKGVSLLERFSQQCMEREQRMEKTGNINATTNQPDMESIGNSETTIQRHSAKTQRALGLFRNIHIEKEKGVSLLERFSQQRMEGEQHVEKIGNDYATTNQPDMESIGTSETTLQRRSAKTQRALGLLRNIHIKKEKGVSLLELFRQQLMEKIGNDNATTNQPDMESIGTSIFMDGSKLGVGQGSTKSSRLPKMLVGGYRRPKKQSWNGIVTKKDDWEVMCEKLARSL